MKIIVLAGGISPERNVSLTSGLEIATALVKNGHEVMLLDLWKGKESLDFPPEYQIDSNHWTQNINILEQPTIKDENTIGKGIISLCKTADIVFLALHGSVGENGKLQALLELNNIKFTGSGSKGSMLAMDKILAKRIMTSYNILTPKWIEIENQKLDYKSVSYPCVVKPSSCGSSIGISLVTNEEELKNAIEIGKKYDTHFLIEEKIEGREFSVGILNGEVLPPIEIVTESNFYDYENKYNGKTKEICPANITKDLTKKLKELALKVHKSLRLKDYSRIDFIVDKKNNCYCLEANTLPGMTKTSLMPEEAKAIGLSFEELVEKIILKK